MWRACLLGTCRAHRTLLYWPAPQVTLVLTENEYTKSMWPHSFRLVYSVALHGARTSGWSGGAGGRDGLARPAMQSSIVA